MIIKAPLQIRFSDIDIAGHVHNAVYFYYFEIGRVAFFKALLPNWNWDENGILVARNEADYIKSIKLNDDAYIETTCESVGKKSIILTYEIYRNSASGVKELCTKGRSILVCVNYKTNESVEVFDEWKNILLKDN